MLPTKEFQNIIGKKLKGHGWTLMKTTRMKPFGFIGYNFTQYALKGDDIEVELIAKTPSELVQKIIQHYARANTPSHNSKRQSHSKKR